MIVNKKWTPYILIVLMVVAIVVIKLVKGNNTTPAKPKTTTTNPKDPASSVNRDHGFDRRTSYLKYSNHANCRMDCRKTVSYTHLRAHETVLDLVCRLLLEKKSNNLIYAITL